MDFPKRKTETVEVGGGTVVVRELSLRDRQRINDINQADGPALGVYATCRMGVPEMADMTDDDLDNVSVEYLEDVAASVWDISGMGVSAVDTAEKN